jgi:hypothetical protein
MTDSPALAKAWLMAQRDANRDGKATAVLNLNPYSPLYVCRYYDPRMDSMKELVRIAYPSTVNQGG